MPGIPETAHALRIALRSARLVIPATLLAGALAAQEPARAPGESAQVLGHPDAAPPAGMPGGAPPGVARGPASARPPSPPTEVAVTEVDFLAARPLAARAAGGGGPAELGLARVAVRLALPTVVRGRGRTVLVQSLVSERYDLQAQGAAGGAVPDVLYRIGYGALVSHQVRGPWRLTAGAQLTLASDLERVGTEQLQLTGQLLATRRASPSLEWGVGAAWINVGPGLVPALLLRWRDARQRLEVLPPVRVEYARRLGARAEAGVSARLLGGRFNRGAEDAVGADRVDLIDLVAGPWAAVRVGPFALRGDVGLAALRRLRVGDASSPDAPSRVLDPQPALWFRAGASASF